MAAIREDWTAVEELDAHFNAARRASIEERLSPARTAEKNALANVRLKSGLAGLCIGAGVGLACWGASLVIQPKIIEKPVVTEKLVYVDKPIVTEKVVTVEKPFIVEKIIRVPATSDQTAVAKPISKPQTEEQFRNQPDFKNAQYSGIIESYIGGDIVFSGGKNSITSKVVTG